MILYTIYPPEYVLDDPEQAGGAVFQEVEVEGRKILLEIDGEGQGRISRLISTDPDDFLDPRWNPGNMIFWLKPF